MEIEKKESNPDPTPSCWGSLDRDRDRIAGFARDQGDISTLRDRVTFLFCVDTKSSERILNAPKIKTQLLLGFFEAKNCFH